ncbi:MAG: DUF5063 domain-containing protein [Bacteroidaceae bacterium]|nr:DUF5063 domain-containing protein [Bacteroidaceae bacterium]
MANPKQNPIYAHDTLEFVTVAAEYCALMEKCENREEKELVETLLKLLPLTYMKMQLLPEVETDGAFVPDDQVTEEDYNYIRSCAYRLLRKHDEYEMLVWDEDMQTEESRWCSVSEGLADLYQALRNFVAVYQQRLESCMPDALWQLRENFEIYWGQTLLDTLRQLHRIRYSMSIAADEEDS